MQIVNIPYGESQVSFSVADDIRVDRLDLNDYPVVPDVQAEIRRSLENPIQSLRLRDLVSEGETVAVIVSDTSRLNYHTDWFLPAVLEELRQGGVHNSDVTIVVANGTHDPLNDEEKIQVVGREVFAHYCVENHDCHADDLVYMGRTSNGTEVWINHTVATADRVVLTGGICYHIFAGFGGGRKSVSPGVAGYDTIMGNHSLCMSRTEKSKLNELCNCGILDGNPLHNDMLEIQDMVKPDFLLNVVTNDHGEYCAVVSGDPLEAFLAGVEITKKVFGVKAHQKYDLALVSMGGYPKDINIFQGLKGIHNASFVMNPGASMIYSCHCFDGFGPDAYRAGFRYETAEEISEVLNESYDAILALCMRMRTFTQNMKIYMISSLPDEDVRMIGMIPVHSAEEAWELARQDHPDCRELMVLPCGGLAYPILDPQT